MQTPDKRKCRRCHGRGMINVKRRGGFVKRPCPACNGNGSGYATK
jgi:DnaJ-class molecular chaperone